MREVTWKPVRVHAAARTSTWRCTISRHMKSDICTQENQTSGCIEWSPLVITSARSIVPYIKVHDWIPNISNKEPKTKRYCSWNITTVRIQTISTHWPCVWWTAGAQKRALIERFSVSSVEDRKIWPKKNTWLKKSHFDVTCTWKVLKDLWDFALFSSLHWPFTHQKIFYFCNCYSLIIKIAWGCSPSVFTARRCLWWDGLGGRRAPYIPTAHYWAKNKELTQVYFSGFPLGNHRLLCFKRMEQPLVLEFTQEGSLKDFVADNISYFHVPRKKPCAPRLNEVGDEATGRQSQYIFDTVPEVA